MKFTFSQNVMEKGLQQVIGTISARMPMPSLSNIHLKLNGKMLEMTSTDLEVTTTAFIELIDSEGSGGFLIPAKRFADIVRELPDVPLDLDVPEPGKVYLTGEFKGKYTLPGGDPEDFPELPPVEKKALFKIHADVFKRIVGKTLFAVSRDEMRPVLTGLFMRIRPGSLTVVATDGHRLSRLTREGIDYDGDSIDVIIPMKALNLIQRTIQDEEVIEITLAETKASFATERLSLITRLIDGRYPNYESVIPMNNPGRLLARTSDFMATIKRVHIFASQLSHQVLLHLDNVQMDLKSEDQEIGSEAKESLDISYEGAVMDIAYNGSYLMDMLRQIDTEEVVFEMNTHEDAVVIRPTSQQTDEDFLMLLMPIRLR